MHIVSILEGKTQSALLVWDGVQCEISATGSSVEFVAICH